jgi:hypothetical protein
VVWMWFICSFIRCCYYSSRFWWQPCPLLPLFGYVYKCTLTTIKWMTPVRIPLNSSLCLAVIILHTNPNGISTCTPHIWGLGGLRGSGHTVNKCQEMLLSFPQPRAMKSRVLKLFEYCHLDIQTTVPRLGIHQSHSKCQDITATGLYPNY